MARLRKLGLAILQVGIGEFAMRIHRCYRGLMVKASATGGCLNHQSVSLTRHCAGDRKHYAFTGAE